MRNACAHSPPCRALPKTLLAAKSGRGVSSGCRRHQRSLSHVEVTIGRAYAPQGNATKARAACQDFFAYWKDADPDIPILKQAKAEYAKLQ